VGGYVIGNLAGENWRSLMATVVAVAGACGQECENVEGPRPESKNARSYLQLSP
jgi:hypothetical protein